MQVLEQHDGRPLGDELLEEGDPRLVEPVAGGERMQVARDVEAEREAEDLAVPEQLADALGRIVLADGQVLLDHLADRPVGDLAIRKAAPRALQRVRRLAREPSPELANEPGLAHSRVAHDRDEVRLLLRDGATVGRLKQVELGLPADEDRFTSPDPAGPHEGDRAPEPAASNAAGLSLRLDLPGLLELERSANGCDRPVADQDLSGLRRLLEPRRNIDGIAGQEGAADPRGPDHDFARVHADADGQAVAEQLLHTPAHREGGVEGALGVVLLRRRSAERGEHRVARELLDRTAGRRNLSLHRVVEAVHQRSDALGILLGGERGRADDVCEEHRDELALLGRLHFARF